ncbi:type 1 periplasmic binding fold superfamily protein [Muricauda oceani]|uniref:Type 1 periplasmic binding fold superfamily protein n=1 Tax=Flagellimonas oceani TaxID=2698672 RepID=A0A6G7J1Y0_9FLAO|nr:type 1 periplasmic binding fold superfamily protein [Allomuricauda oceani]MBW8241544.1 type 1 periplasmic binding fold superfamily protein [Allomuricauda oceani]QII44462.1 type 1 periplasmic binding fold superfamily protein [Allomuricauda oceani]
MKTIKILSLLTVAATTFMACSSDDDAPEPVNEEETITTMTVSLVAPGGGTTVTLQSRDLDGDGPNAPDVTVSGNLAANTTYTGSVVFLNETESPAEDITEEVEEEDEEHQVFYIPTGNITDITYDDEDGDGNPLGLAFTLETGDAGNATLAVTLIHEPKKPNDGTLADAGGEPDFTETFQITIE